MGWRISTLLTPMEEDSMEAKKDITRLHIFLHILHFYIIKQLTICKNN
jgi:hypothetical protein